MAARPGQVRAGPASGRDWEAAFPPSLGRMGQGPRAGLISCPAHCPPRPSSAFLIHSEGLGLCFQHISKDSQAGSFWNFPWELVSWSFSVHRETELCHIGGPGHHLATWGGSSALGVTKAPLLPPRPTRNHKSTGGWGGISNRGLFLTNAQAPDDGTNP